MTAHVSVGLGGNPGGFDFGGHPSAPPTPPRPVPMYMVISPLYGVRIPPL